MLRTARTVRSTENECVCATADDAGKLSINSSDFQAALTQNAEDLKTFFAGSTTTSGLSDNTDSTGLADLLRASVDNYINSSTGMLISREERIDSALKDIDDDRLDVISRMETLEAQYTKQFTAMNTLVGTLRGTSDFLTNQMDAIKAAANR